VSRCTLRMRGGLLNEQVVVGFTLCALPSLLPGERPCATARARRAKHRGRSRVLLSVGREHRSEGARAPPRGEGSARPTGRDFMMQARPWQLFVGAILLATCSSPSGRADPPPKSSDKPAKSKAEVAKALADASSETAEPPTDVDPKLLEDLGTCYTDPG